MLTYNHYPVGWAHAMDSPLQWMKQVASHFGGTRNGMVMSWPSGIKEKGGVRSQFCQVIDIVPTIYEAIGITPPKVMDGVEQKPLDGTSLVYTFDNAKAPARHTTQYFEMFGNRAIYKDGRMASTTPLDETFDVGEDTGTPVIEDYANRMPFRFTGTLKKVVVVLEPEKLSEEERKRLLAEEAMASIIAQ